jgi:phosphate starvation-inducible PhoH-like protein
VFGAIRGRSFTNAVIIVDEFQNITHDNAKTFLTRFSDNTKVIVLGDSGQIDLKDKKESSLERLVARVKRSVIEGVEVVEFLESDVVRHRLTSYFIQMFKEPEEAKIIQKPIRPSIRVIPEPTFFQKLKKFFSK